MSLVHLWNLEIPRNQPADRQGMFRTRTSGSGHDSGWQDTEGNHTHTSIHLPIQQRRQARGLEGYGSISSAPPTTQRFILIEHGQQLV
ncbi:hypothetical protein O181_047614 [Austropuccinia psidii MF-1]|uniref:Uncharacterized protein n=1 Tax=Austropuccinia psidii MF-1 TaxID=1389203 RepID=A0A9Q3DRC9_9BASI|nr:hypothetical protein [Austropuccinia psidii MF-1]